MDQTKFDSRTPGLPSRWRFWAVVFCFAAVVAIGADEKTYVVKRHDTLYGIARANGISPAQLADRNGLSHKAFVYVGQKLIIPTKSSADKPAAQSAPLDESVRKAIASAKVAPGRWKYIVIHHSGVDEGSLKSIDRYHREERHMENGLAYHFLIGNGRGMGDGEVAVGNRWKEQLDGGHLRSLKQNQTALGICLIGNFDKTKPTAKQLRSLETLTRALMKRCNLTGTAVKTHQQINVVHTRCPGSKFPTRAFLADLKE